MSYITLTYGDKKIQSLDVLAPDFSYVQLTTTQDVNYTTNLTEKIFLHFFDHHQI